MLLAILLSKWHPNLPFLEVKSLESLGYLVEEKHDELTLIKPKKEKETKKNAFFAAFAFTRNF